MKVFKKLLLFEEKGNVVEGRDVVDGEDLGSGDVTEHRHFGGNGEGERRRAAASNLNNPKEEGVSHLCQIIRKKRGRRAKSGVRPNPRRSRMLA